MCPSLFLLLTLGILLYQCCGLTGDVDHLKSRIWGVKKASEDGIQTCTLGLANLDFLSLLFLLTCACAQMGSGIRCYIVVTGAS